MKLTTKIAVLIVIAIILIGSAYYVLVWRSETTTATTTTITTSTSLTSSSTTTSYTTGESSSLGEKLIEIKAFDVSKGKTEYTAGNDFTATQLLSLVQSIHNTIGNFNIIRFIRVQCDNGIVNPDLMASQISGNGYNWNGTLNSYFTAIQQAAGGIIIPDAGMDILINVASQNDCSEAASSAAYYQDTASLLTLSAISQEPKVLMMEAWDAWYANNAPSQPTVASLMQTLEAQGWQDLMPQDNGPFANTADTPSCSTQYAEYPDYGYASYIRNGIFVINQTSPYVFPNYNLTCSISNAEPYLKGIVVGIESQLQATNPAYLCGGVQYDYAITDFAQCLTTSQQETALTNLAANQQRYGYIFIYPVVVGEYLVQYNAQQAGTLNLIEHLINQYN